MTDTHENSTKDSLAGRSPQPEGLGEGSPLPGRKVRTHDALVGVTGRLSRRLSSLAAGLEAAMAKIARELPIAESRLKEARMLASAARKEAHLLDELSEIDDDPPVVTRRVDARELISSAAGDIAQLEERGIRVVESPMESAVHLSGDPDPLRRIVRRFAAYAGEVLGPGGIFRIAFDDLGLARPARNAIKATFSFDGFRPRADDVDLDGGKLMTSIEADLRLACAIASVESCGGEARVERHGPRSASVHAILPRAPEVVRMNLLGSNGSYGTNGTNGTNGTHAPTNGTHAPVNGPHAPSNGTHAKPAGTLPTVLVVEDQEAIRRLFVLGLEAEGYRALEAEDGRRALVVLEAHKGPIEAIFTDRRMPHMGGDELARRVTALRPGTRIVLVTAHPPERGELDPALEKLIQVVEKPTTIAELVGALRRTA